MKIKVQKYKKICKIEDVIITNGDGDVGRANIEKRGRVIFRDNFLFTIKTETHGNWTVDFRPRAGHEIWVQVLSPYKNTKKLKKRTGKQEKIFIEAKRLKTGLAIVLTIPQQLEDYYKNISAGAVQESKSWLSEDGKGVQFYNIAEETRTHEREVDYETFSDFGHGLFERDRINTAMLRVVGASNGVIIMSKNFNKVNNVDLQYYIQRLGEFVKKMFETTLSEASVKAVITFEF